MFQNPYGTNRISITDVIPGLGKWVMQNRQKAMQPIMDAGRQRAMSLLGTEGTGFDEINENTRFEDVQEAQGLLADPEDFGNQMRFSLGLLGTPGYSDLGSNIASQAMRQQLGLPMQRQKMQAQLTKPTTAMQNLQAAGYTPGTPEYEQAMNNYLMKANNVTNIDLSQGERVAAAYAGEAASSAEQIAQMEDNGYRPSWSDEMASKLPFGVGNYAVSDDYRQYKSEANNWIQANLRPESGAVISEAEMETYYQTYFPQAGDDENTVLRKKRLRDQKLQSRMQQAGRAESKVIEQKVPLIPPGWEVLPE